MAIEIRELVIKATVTKGRSTDKDSFVDRQELSKMRKEIIRECLYRMRDELDDLRTAR